MVGRWYLYIRIQIKKISITLEFCAEWLFFFQAEDGIRDAQESRGLGDVYKRQAYGKRVIVVVNQVDLLDEAERDQVRDFVLEQSRLCLLYTSDAADDLLCVDLGGRRIIKKTKNIIVPLTFFPEHINK